MASSFAVTVIATFAGFDRILLTGDHSSVVIFICIYRDSPDVAGLSHWETGYVARPWKVRPAGPPDHGPADGGVSPGQRPRALRRRQPARGHDRDGRLVQPRARHCRAYRIRRLAPDARAYR